MFKIKIMIMVRVSFRARFRVSDLSGFRIRVGDSGRLEDGARIKVSVRVKAKARP